MTRNCEICDRLLMMLSVSPSERYSASGSALALMNGSTAKESIGFLTLLVVSLMRTSVGAPERFEIFTSLTVICFTSAVKR